MEDPIEQRLRELMQGNQAEDCESVDDARMERVLHRVHVRSGVFDLLGLFANWGWVISEGGSRGLRHARPARRGTSASSDSSNNQST
ncbi:hypothetical protein GCM10007418_22810 [Halopseudomonas salina]|uniref:Uncharacterized protein n=2 Tax=Halopseudomonas salina TaxID=1323744 RepID=A0ABQ1PT77_9GAMM|nr:hypothetical protein GCM10007418_22810 [Halopseudomonas salina]